MMWNLCLIVAFCGTGQAKIVPEKYDSLAEGRKISFQVALPPNYSSAKKYPLFVQLFGDKNMLPNDEYSYIRVRPSGRGVWGYRAMSRYDVLQVVERTKQIYSVDDDRVYITGTSAGATGIMHVVAQRPDVFAAAIPLVAFGNDLPLVNFRNLPLQCEHGVNDWTSAIGNVRVQFIKLNRFGISCATLNQHPNAGHGIRRPPPSTMKWLMRQKRNNQPKHITYTCEHPRDGRAYWLRIARLLDPHQPAHVDAQFQNNLLRIQTRNIQELEIDLANAPVSKDSQLSIDTTKLNITTEVTTLRLSNRDGIWSKTRPLAKTSQREYGAGAAASLFQGEPLVVVYGTSGSPREQSLLRTTATTLARCGGPHFKSASVYFPVKPDTKLTEEDISSKNLILVGTPQNHSFLKRIAKQLPVQTEDSQLHAATRSALPLRGKVLSLHYYNPVSPKRYIYIVAPYLNDTQQTVFLRNPRRYLAGSDGFKMVDQPDLIVRDFNLKIVREMQFNSKWEFIKYPGDNQRFPAEFSKREALAIAHIKAMQKSSNADFSLWWGPEDKGLFGGYDFNWLPRLSPAHYTKADYLVRHRETETMLGSIPGNELISLYDRWIAKREIIAWPAMNRATLDPKRSYRVIIPMDLVPKLGIRRRTLGNVAPGPNIMPHQILNEIFD